MEEVEEQVTQSTWKMSTARRSDKPNKTSAVSLVLRGLHFQSSSNIVETISHSFFQKDANKAAIEDQK